MGSLDLFLPIMALRLHVIELIAHESQLGAQAVDFRLKFGSLTGRVEDFIVEVCANSLDLRGERTILANFVEPCVNAVAELLELFAEVRKLVAISQDGIAYLKRSFDVADQGTESDFGSVDGSPPLLSTNLNAVAIISTFLQRW